MRSNSRQLRLVLGLMLSGLLLTASCLGGAGPVAAQDSIPDRGAGRAPDRGGGHGGMGGIGAGLAIGVGGALLEQMMRPRPVSTGVDQPSGKKKKNTASKNGMDFKRP